jgi:hypothetical protein
MNCFKVYSKVDFESRLRVENIKKGAFLLNWIKKRQEAVEAKPIVPKNRLYFLLLIGAIVLTGVSLLVQENEAVFTIWTSITCGSVASIIVAWLIDAANCRQLIKKNLDNREALFKNLYPDLLFAEHSFSTEPDYENAITV